MYSNKEFTFAKYNSDFSKIYSDNIKTVDSLAPYTICKINSPEIHTSFNLATDTHNIKISWRENGNKVTHAFNIAWNDIDNIMYYLKVRLSDYPDDFVDWLIKNLFHTEYTSHVYKVGNSLTPDDVAKAVDVAEAAKHLPGMEIVVATPCEHSFEISLYQVIIHLNDKHRWTRKEIADWVELIERRDNLDLTFKETQ